jgi:hypothetical protein
VTTSHCYCRFARALRIESSHCARAQCYAECLPILADAVSTEGARTGDAATTARKAFVLDSVTRVARTALPPDACADARWPARRDCVVACALAGDVVSELLRAVPEWLSSVPAPADGALLRLVDLVATLASKTQDTAAVGATCNAIVTHCASAGELTPTRLDALSRLLARVSVDVRATAVADLVRSAPAWLALDVLAASACALVVALVAAHCRAGVSADAIALWDRCVSAASSPAALCRAAREVVPLDVRRDRPQMRELVTRMIDVRFDGAVPADVELVDVVLEENLIGSTQLGSLAQCVIDCLSSSSTTGSRMAVVCVLVPALVARCVGDSSTQALVLPLLGAVLKRTVGGEVHAVACWKRVCSTANHALLALVDWRALVDIVLRAPLEGGTATVTLTRLLLLAASAPVHERAVAEIMIASLLSSSTAASSSSSSATLSQDDAECIALASAGASAIDALRVGAVVTETTDVDARLEALVPLMLSRVSNDVARQVLASANVQKPLLLLAYAEATRRLYGGARARPRIALFAQQLLSEFGVDAQWLEVACGAAIDEAMRATTCVATVALVALLEALSADVVLADNNNNNTRLASLLSSRLESLLSDERPVTARRVALVAAVARAVVTLDAAADTGDVLTALAVFVRAQRGQPVSVTRALALDMAACVFSALLPWPRSPAAAAGVDVAKAVFDSDDPFALDALCDELGVLCESTEALDAAARVRLALLLLPRAAGTVRTRRNASVGVALVAAMRRVGAVLVERCARRDADTELEYASTLFAHAAVHAKRLSGGAAVSANRVADVEAVASGAGEWSDSVVRLFAGRHRRASDTGSLALAALSARAAAAADCALSNDVDCDDALFALLLRAGAARVQAAAHALVSQRVRAYATAYTQDPATSASSSSTSLRSSGADDETTDVLEELSVPVALAVALQRAIESK